MSTLNSEHYIKVLLVDDAVLITKRIAEMVQEVVGVSEIIIAHDYTTAINAIVQHDPHVVLLDIHLPDKSGIDVLDFITSSFPHIKVVMITNKIALYYKEMCLQKGAMHFVDKSKDFESIPEIIATYCKN